MSTANERTLQDRIKLLERESKINQARFVEMENYIKYLNDACNKLSLELVTARKNTKTKKGNLPK